MFNLGTGEIIVVLLLVLIFVGPSKLPELASGLGKLIREFRKVTSDVKNEIVLDDAIRKPFEELRDAVTLAPEELKRRDQVRKAMEEAARKREGENAAAAAALASLTSASQAPAPGETPAEAAAAVVTAPAAASGDVAAIVPPVAPPAGTVARNPPAPVPAPPGTPAAASERAPSGPIPPPPTGSRVTPPLSSLAGERANVTQSLSEADLLAGATPAPKRRPTPPPLPGVTRKPPPPGPNATQILADNDLLAPGAPPASGVKPPPVPGAKKS